MVDKVNVTGALPVASHKLLVPRGALRFRIARQHALDAHADALRTLYRAPTLASEQIQADDAV